MIKEKERERGGRRVIEREIKKKTGQAVLLSRTI